jgi:glutamate formiminotransferase / 5-formyltetrahydrofolate cyclo-ligase
VLASVVNISEGRDADRLLALAEVVGPALLDLHADGDHHRAVFTLAGTRAPRALATRAVELLDIRDHAGAHPRLGVVDVVPFVPLDEASWADAIAARDAFATWLTTEHEVPCFLYGPERSLPDVRRHAFRDLAPDAGPASPHPTAGATAVGARHPLVAFNVWMASPDLAVAKEVAAAVRGPTIRALGLQVGAATQVSMNLVEPLVTGPREARALVVQHLRAAGASIDRTELVGLVPEAVLRATPEGEWTDLDLGADRTIEARLARRAAEEAGPRGCS